MPFMGSLSKRLLKPSVPQALSEMLGGHNDALEAGERRLPGCPHPAPHRRTLPWSPSQHGAEEGSEDGGGGGGGKGGEGVWMCSEMNESLQKEQDAHKYKQPTPLL